MKTVSIKTKIAVAVVACLVVIAAANALLARYNYRRDMAYAGEQAVRAAGRSLRGIEKREIDKLSTALDALIGEPTLAAFMAQRDRDNLLEAAAPIFKELQARHGVTHWYFIEPAPARTCFLRVHRPELRGDVIDRQTLLAAIRTGDTAAGKELGQTAFALRVVRPFAPKGKLLGYMELGQEIDDFLVRMKEETGDEYALVVGKRFLNAQEWAATRGERRNNWNDDPDFVTVDATDREPGVFGPGGEVRDLPDAGRYLGVAQRGSRLFVRGVVPVADAAGQRVGGLFVLHDVTALRDRALSEQTNVVVLIGAVAVVMLSILYILVEVLVFRRLARTTQAMQHLSIRLAGGDYDVGGTIKPASSDEIGKFEGFLGSFLSTIGSTLRELEKKHRRTG
jgi:hypothetical protein